MSFTIKCDKCGEEQILKEDDVYHKDKISLEIEQYPVDSWDTLIIGCNKCGQVI